ncbi:MAG: aldehyde dehydrogenase family protein [Acidimicrobiales bacterium]
MAVTRGAQVVAGAGGPDEIGAAERANLDGRLAALADRAPTWARLGAAARATLLARVVRDTAAVAEEWNAAACAAKGYEVDSPEGGEELFSGVGTLVTLAQALRRSMEDLATEGRPRYPGPVRHRSGDRVSIGVLPANAFDRVLYAGIRAEVWMEPGVDEASVRANQAALYRHPFEAVGVALVLGAGNVASLGPRDALHKLFVEGKVVILKANPVNDYLVPYWERALAALVEGGFLTIVRGGAAVGSHLANHALVDEIHVTGSDKTHDAIVFGPGEAGSVRKALDQPLLDKPVSCELGNVSPVVVVPGEWSRREIEYQARHVATMLVNNAGFNCLTPRVLVTYARWRQREEFLDALATVLATIPTRRAYYPGAADRRAMFLAAHPDAREIGDGSEGRMAWTIVRDVDPTVVDDVCLNVEAFCALTSETALDAVDPADFVDRAVTFCNEVVWGSLSMTLLADPRTMADPRTGPAIERAVADLRYGSIGLNVWHALSFVVATTAWGAYPGHDRTDIQSGRGVVGNAFLFAQPQKSVVRGPFVSRPDPAWFATNRRAATVMRALLAFEASPSWWRLPVLLAAALRP